MYLSILFFTLLLVFLIAVCCIVQSYNVTQVQVLKVVTPADGTVMGGAGNLIRLKVTTQEFGKAHLWVCL